MLFIHFFVCQTVVVQCTIEGALNSGICRRVAACRLIGLDVRAVKIAADVAGDQNGNGQRITAGLRVQFTACEARDRSVTLYSVSLSVVALLLI